MHPSIPVLDLAGTPAQVGAAHGESQRQRIRETVISSGPRVTSVNFSVRVGTAVPRSVRVVAVPSVIVEIHPEWRSYLYFIYNDEIIIVDRNHRIIAIIEV